MHTVDASPEMTGISLTGKIKTQVAAPSAGKRYHHGSDRSRRTIFRYFYKIPQTLPRLKILRVEPNLPPLRKRKKKVNPVFEILIELYLDYRNKQKFYRQYFEKIRNDSSWNWTEIDRN